MQILKRALSLSVLQLCFAGLAFAQDDGAPCTKDSVVLTRCAEQVPNNGLPAPAAVVNDQQQKQQLQRSLDRQRDSSSAAATQTDDDGNTLQRVEVTGVRQRQPTASEVFDKDLGTPDNEKPLTTQTSDSMGNRTECISKCNGPACCKTTPANPATPGVINSSTP
jgi:hypothetical protein